jgi:hypothetical protein
MITFLAQLREGCSMRYDNINTKFSRSLALDGMKNIADRSGDGGVFNIVKESFLLPNFSSNDIYSLCSQHTQTTGQIFEDKDIERAWHWTQGQPWLVNALARDIVA